MLLSILLRIKYMQCSPFKIQSTPDRIKSHATFHSKKMPQTGRSFHFMLTNKNDKNLLPPLNFSQIQ